jgi:hypothetical protein
LLRLSLTRIHNLPVSEIRAAGQEQEPSQAAKPPVPSLIFGDGFLKVCFPKIRPKRIGDDHFRVADLPEKEVGNPAFSAGANEKVGVGDRGEKTVADRS